MKNDKNVAFEERTYRGQSYSLAISGNQPLRQWNSALLWQGL